MLCFVLINNDTLVNCCHVMVGDGMQVSVFKVHFASGPCVWVFHVRATVGVCVCVCVCCVVFGPNI